MLGKIPLRIGGWQKDQSPSRIARRKGISREKPARDVLPTFPDTEKGKQGEGTPKSISRMCAKQGNKEGTQGEIQLFSRWWAAQKCARFNEIE